MRMTRLLLAVVTLVSSAAHAQTPAPGALAPLSFLVGAWEAIPDPATGTGTCAFAWSLQDQVIVRTNHADVPAANGRPAASHDDLMVIYVDGKTAKADYWDNESHVIHYIVEAHGSSSVVFLAEATASTPGYRLTYTLQPDGSVKGQFEFAQPGKPGVWATYLSWGMRRAKRERASA